MIGWDKANERLTSITSWLIGIDALMLTVFLTVSVNKKPYPPEGELVEGIVIILLILSLCLYSLAASFLARPYYATEVNPAKLESSVVSARRLAIFGTVFIFWAIGGMILLSLGINFRSQMYFGIAFVSPLIWLLIRYKSNIKL